MATAPFARLWRKLVNLFSPADQNTDSPAERRGHKRFPGSGTLTLHWTAPMPGMSKVKIRNVSLEGLQVEMPEAVEAPQLVRLSGENSEYTGWILYCQEEGPKIVAGIHLIDPE